MLFRSVHLTDPNFALRAAAWYATRAVAVPKPYLAGAAQLMRETAKTRAKQAELQRKAKSPRHDPAEAISAAAARNS